MITIMLRSGRGDDYVSINYQKFKGDDKRHKITGRAVTKFKFRFLLNDSVTDKQIFVTVVIEKLSHKQINKQGKQA